MMPDVSLNSIDRTVYERHSVRSFLADAVSDETICEILSIAARAPSGTNIQPWKAYVVDRHKIDEVAAAIKECGVKPERATWSDYQYYPKPFFEPYLSRRRSVGAALYKLLHINRRDVSSMRSHFNRNFEFFGAPVGIFISIDRRLEVGSWLDLGMFIQNVLIVAQGRGLATCPQAAFAPFHENIRPIIKMPDNEILVCGIALGFEDKSKPENKLRTDRAPMNDWVKIVS